MAFNHDTEQNVILLASLLGFEAVVAKAWLRSEGQDVNNPTNPLNIRYYGRAGQRPGPGATGESGVGFASYESPDAGLSDAVKMLHDLAGQTWNGYQSILDQAGSRDPIAQAKSIEMSKWAAGHYGGSEDRDGIIRRLVREFGFTPARDPMLNLSGYPRRYRVTRGTSFFEMAGDTSPIGTFSGDATIEIIGRAKSPSNWYLGHVTTAAGWPDRTRRDSGVWLLIPGQPAWVA